MTFSSDNPDMGMAIGMMEGSKMSIEFAPGKSRSEVTMGTMGLMTTIVDEKSDKSLVLMDMMGMKYAVTGNLKEVEKKEAAKKPDYKVEITKDTKTIAGYTCTKAIMTGDNGSIIDVWFTKEIEAFTAGQTYYNSDMPGFPMSFKMNEEDMVIEMTVTEISKKVNKTNFSMTVPEGYEVKTQEEMEMMGK